jgi:uncharacterized alkaline shock family protein YloU
MSDGASDTYATPAEPAPATSVSTQDTSERYLAQASEFAGRVGDQASEFAGRVGEQAGEFAERAAEQAGELKEKVGVAAERAAAATGRIATQVVDRLRNNAELAAERGTTTIANEVVEKIAAIATREVPGVYDLGGDVARLFATVKEKIGLGGGSESADQGVSVRLEGTTAAVTITLVIEYGFVVYSVTEKVRAKVISAVENLLGLEVTEVNIVVDDVHIVDKEPAGDDEARASTFQ